MKKIKKILLNEHSFIDMINEKFCLDDKFENFTELDFNIFELFANNPNQLIYYNKIRECWKSKKYEPSDQNAKEQVGKLRKKIVAFCEIKNHQGRGYELTFKEGVKIEFQNSDSIEIEKIAEETFGNSLQVLICGIKKYFKELSNNYINTATFSHNIVPYVKDIDNWLGGIYEKTLIETVILLWQQDIRDGLFIGKSGGGKSAAFLACSNYLLENYPTVIPIYINLEECFNGSGEDRILKYIQSHYTDKMSLTELKNMIFEDVNEKKDSPSFVLLLDGLSNCINSTETANDIAILQKEFSLYNKSHIQLIFSAVNEHFPFTLGKISKQAFEIQGLSKKQIEDYLDSVCINRTGNTPYHILSNPFMLSIYAKTEDFVGSQNSQFKNKFRENISTEADILFNFFEAIAVKFADKSETINRNKAFFAFDFILPKIAYYMSINVRQHISKLEIDICVQETIKLLENVAFVTRFEDHYGEEYRFKINDLIGWFVQQTGILSTSERGYTFNSSVFRNYLCAKHIYNIVLMQNESFELSDICKQTLESGSLSYETRRYLGELCEEYKNKPYEDEKIGWVFPNKSRLLLHIIDLYRNNTSNKAKIAISNIVSAIAACRERDLSGLNLSFLDLRRLTFSNIVCSRPSKSGYVATNFSGSDIDQWFFKTVQFCKDRSSVKFLKSRNKIVSTSGGGSFRLFNLVGDYTELSVCQNDFIQSLDISPDETKIVISCLYSGIYEYIIDENKLVQLINGYGVMFGIAKYITPDKVAYFTRDKKVFVYDVLNSSKISTVDFSANNFCYDFERDAIIVASRSREIVRFNFNRQSFDRRFSTADISDSYIMQVAIDGIKGTVIYCTKDGIVAEWDIIKNETTTAYSVLGEIDDFVLSDDFTKIYCITENNGLYIIDRLTQELVNYKIPNKGRWSSIDNNGDSLVICSVEGGLLLYSIEKEEFDIIFDINPQYRSPELHIKGCSFKNAKFSNNVTKNFLTILENEGGIL